MIESQLVDHCGVQTPKACRGAPEVFGDEKMD